MKQGLKIFVMAAALLSLAGCASFSNIPRVSGIKDAIPLKDGPAPEYRLEAGDTLDIKFFYSADLNENVTIRPDGRISLQLIDDIMAEGRTASELDEELTKRYTRVLPDKPDLRVIVKGFGDARIYVTGEVADPGEKALKNRITAFQAVASAGGFRDSAARSTVLVIRQDRDGNSAVMRADLSDDNIASKNAEAHVRLMPRDVVYVPKSDIAKADLFVDQHIRQLLLFNGISAGVSGVYELNNKDKFNAPN